MRENISLVKPEKLPSRSEVIRILSRQLHFLDKGAKLIDTNIETACTIPIHILAENKEGNPIIINVFSGADESWLVDTLHQLRWLEDNYESVAKKCGLPAGDSDIYIKCMIFVARFSPKVASALNYIKDIPIQCFQVRCFSNGNERFLVLEEKVSKQYNKTSKEVSLKKEVLKPVELTAAEIGDFLDAKKSVEPGTKQQFI